MRKYRAVIIDFRRILKSGAMVLLSAAVAISALNIAYKRVLSDDKLAEKIVRQNIAAIDAMASGDETLARYINRAGRWMSGVIFGFVPTDAESIISGNLVLYHRATMDNAIYNRSGGVVVSKTKRAEQSRDSTELWENSIPEENRAPIKSINAAQRVSGGASVAIGNETSYGVDLEAMLGSKPQFEFRGNGPKILITHTHATESYAPNGAEVYDVTRGDRDEDKTKNVVAVGQRMKKVFEDYGIETIHDEILHDVPSFNGSYAHSLNTVSEYIEKYPSIQIVFDIHRDSIVYDDKTKAKTVTEIDEERAAQLMFVVGTDANGLEHPNWRENMKSAVWFQKVISEKHPTLMRHINLRKERFNGHTTEASMIIEVGTSGNSLDEALYGIELATEALAQWMNQNN